MLDSASPSVAARIPGAGGTTSTRSTGPGRSRQSAACHGAPSSTISACGYAERSASSAGRTKMKSPSALARSTAIRATSGTNPVAGVSRGATTPRRYRPDSSAMTSGWCSSRSAAGSALLGVPPEKPARRGPVRPTVMVRGVGRVARGSRTRSRP